MKRRTIFKLSILALTCFTLLETHLANQVKVTKLAEPDIVYRTEDLDDLDIGRGN